MMIHRSESLQRNHLTGRKHTMPVMLVMLAIVFVLTVTCVPCRVAGQSVYAEENSQQQETGQQTEEASSAPEETVKPKKKTKPEPKVNVVSVKRYGKSRSKAVITIKKAQLKGKAAKKVKVLTWSKTKGRVDLVRYKAKKVRANTWRVKIDATKHCYSGVFFARVYVNGKWVRIYTKGKKVKHLTYKMGFPAYKGRLIRHAQKKSSRTGWLVLVDKQTHRVGIFRGSKGRWKLFRYWLCGDGKASTPTPSGTFIIGVKGPYFDAINARCYYFTNFYPHYYFHSVLCNPRTAMPQGGTQLGAGVSHGCVRLAVENARWLQNNVPAGSTVYIYR